MAIAQILQRGVQTAIEDYAMAPIADSIIFLTPLLLGGMTLYIMVMGYAIASGNAQENLTQFAWRVAKIGLLVALALTANNYSFYIVDLVTSVEQGMVDLLHGDRRSVNDPNISIGRMVDENVVYIEAVARTLYDNATKPDMPDLPLMSAALMATFCQIAVAAGTLIPLLVAKVTLKLLLAIGPFFLILAIFPITQKYTEAWFSATLTALFTVVFVTVVIGFLPYYTGQYTSTLFWSTTPTLFNGIVQPPPNQLEDVLNKLGELIIILTSLWIIWRIAGFTASLFNSGTWQRATHSTLGYFSGKNTSSTYVSSSSPTSMPTATYESSQASLAQQHVINHIHKN